MTLVGVQASSVITCATVMPADCRCNKEDSTRPGYCRPKTVKSGKERLDLTFKVMDIRIKFLMRFLNNVRVLRYKTGIR